MILYNKNEKYVSLFEDNTQFTKDFINEERGISYCVDAEAKRIFKLITSILLDNNKIQDTIKHPDGKIYQFIYKEKINLFSDFECTLDCEICVVNSLSLFLKLDNQFETELSFDNEGKVLTFHDCIVCNGFNLECVNIHPQLSTSYVGIISHELKHAYQYFMKFGAYETGNYLKRNDVKLYNTAVDEFNNFKNTSMGIDRMKAEIGFCIYSSFTSELTANEQELYRNIKDNVANFNNIWVFVRESEQYLTFQIFQNLQSNVERYKKQLEQYISAVYNRNWGWLMKRIDDTIKNYRRLINRAVWAVLKNNPPLVQDKGIKRRRSQDY